ncbi:hypothetical protein HDU82_005375, partial [Entophlyctis luteolus]
MIHSQRVAGVWLWILAVTCSTPCANAGAQKCKLKGTTSSQPTSVWAASKAEVAVDTRMAAVDPNQSHIVPIASVYTDRKHSSSTPGSLPTAQTKASGSINSPSSFAVHSNMPTTSFTEFNSSETATGTTSASGNVPSRTAQIATWSGVTSASTATATVKATTETANESMTNSLWTAPVGSGWQWQLEGTLDIAEVAAVYDIDVQAVGSVAKVKAIDPKRKVICYVNVGSLETDNSRPDQAQFAAADLGNAYPGWPNEVFVNIRSPAVRAIMIERFRDMLAAGCDAIEPDNMDSYTFDNGFGLTEADEIDYITWFTTEIHALGMAVGSKNGGDLIEKNLTLLQLFDFAVVESCVAFNNCHQYSVFIAAAKPVYAAEYTNAGNGGCEAVTDVVESCATLN